MTKFLIMVLVFALPLMHMNVSLKAQVPTRPTRVLVISLDGARPDALRQVDAPHIQALAGSGSYSWSAQTVFPPATLPAHASLLSGLAPDQHGFDDNVLRSCANFDFPTILTLADSAGYETAMVVGKAPLCQFHTAETVAYALAPAGDRSVVDSVVAYLRNGYEVILAHFPNPDYFGHTEGWMSDAYRYELENTDRQIGRLLDEIERLDLTRETLILLTADHGGHGRVHGRDISADMTIPWIMSGPGVRQDFDLAAPGLQDVTLIDIAPTLLWLLDIPIPVDMQGRVVCEAFDRAIELCP